MLAIVAIRLWENGNTKEGEKVEVTAEGCNKTLGEWKQIHINHFTIDNNSVAIRLWENGNSWSEYKLSDLDRVAIRLWENGNYT